MPVPSFTTMVDVGRLCEMVLPRVVGADADQDLGESIDLLHHVIYLTVFGTANRNGIR